MTVVALVLLALGAVAVAAAFGYRRRGPDPATRLLDDEEAAYLTGGPAQVLNTALYRLADAGAIRLSRDHLVSGVDGARPGTAVEADLLAPLYLGPTPCLRLRGRAWRAPGMVALERRLRRENLVAPGATPVRVLGSGAMGAAIFVLVMAAGFEAVGRARVPVVVASLLLAVLGSSSLSSPSRRPKGLLAAYDQRRGGVPVARVARRGLAEIPDEALRSALVAALETHGTRAGRRSRWLGSSASGGSGIGYTCGGGGGGHHSCGGGGHHSCGGGSSCGGGGGGCGGGSF